MKITPQMAAGLACIGIAMVIAASVALMALFHSFRKKVGSLNEELAANLTFPEKLNEFKKELDQMQSRIEELEQPRSTRADWFQEAAPMNLNRRGQVLRLHRRGDSSVHIASTLGLSQGEVKLIIKVHELSRARDESEKSDQWSLNTRES